MRGGLVNAGGLHIVKAGRIFQRRNDTRNGHKCFFRRRRETTGRKVVEHVRVKGPPGRVVRDLVDEVETRLVSGAGAEIDEKVSVVSEPETGEKIAGCRGTGDGSCP